MKALIDKELLCDVDFSGFGGRKRGEGHFAIQ